MVRVNGWHVLYRVWCIKTYIINKCVYNICIRFYEIGSGKRVSRCGNVLCTNITIYIHAYIHTYIHSFIHTYIHTYIYTYIYTYIHTYIVAFMESHHNHNTWILQIPKHTQTHALAPKPFVAPKIRSRGDTNNFHQRIIPPHVWQPLLSLPYTPRPSEKVTLINQTIVILFHLINFRWILVTASLFPFVSLCSLYLSLPFLPFSPSSLSHSLHTPLTPTHYRHSTCSLTCTT